MDNLGFGGGATNPYLDKSVNDSLGASVRAFNNTTQPAFTSAMVHSGSFGNSGLQQAQQDSTKQFQDSLGRQANDMYSNNYQFDQQFDRGTYNDAFNHNQQNYQNGINLLGMQNQSNQQNLGFGTQVQNAPMNYYQGFANQATGIGKGFGATNASSTAPGSRLMGALGGAQLGRQFGGLFSGSSNPYNAYNQYSGGNDGYTNPNGESLGS